MPFLATVRVCIWSHSHLMIANIVFPRVGKAIVRCSRTYVGRGGQQGGAPGGPGYPGGMQQQQIGDSDEEDDDDIYTNDDPQNPYYND